MTTVRPRGLTCAGMILAACGPSTEPETATGVQVVVEGLPPANAGASLKLRSEASEFILVPGAPEWIPPGEYTLWSDPVIASSGSEDDLLFACTPDRPRLTVVAGTTTTVRLVCAISARAGLFLYIAGETGGVPAAVERVEGEGVVVYPYSTLDHDIAPGPLTLTARPVTGGGVTYYPVPDRLELTLSAGRVTRATITYQP